MVPIFPPVTYSPTDWTTFQVIWMWYFCLKWKLEVICFFWEKLRVWQPLVKSRSITN